MTYTTPMLYNYIASTMRTLFMQMCCTYFNIIYAISIVYMSRFTLHKNISYASLTMLLPTYSDVSFNDSDS